MEVIIVLETLLLAILFIFEKGYKAALRGVLFHCEMKGMIISSAELKELQEQGMRQMLKEFFHKQR